jgi:magnesium-transporting ATPase (P-type)
MADAKFEFCFVGLVGLVDNVRPSVPLVVRASRESGSLNVRMVTGDHVNTAKKIAKDCRILGSLERNNEFAVMTGEQFREQVGQLVSRQNEEGETVVELENMDAFEVIAHDLRVLARASAVDKQLLACGLRRLGRAVAITGDGLGDVEALRESSVGLCMHSGSEIVKEHADVILTSDNMESIVKAVLWGRNIYHNVAKFLQFQVTVNFSALLTIALGICFFGESPLSPVQLLWVNVIMDTLAAIALSSEPPFPRVLEEKPFSNSTSILSRSIWKSILLMTAWNTLVMAVLILLGQRLLGLDYD